MTNLKRAIALLFFLLLPLASSYAVPAAPQAAPLDVVVSEIAWMGTDASPTDEWIELYNNTAAAVDLSGWTLASADGYPSIALSGVIPAGAHFLLERTDDSTVPAVAADLLYTGALGNDGEDLVLRDGGLAVIDQLDCAAGWYSGHGDARVPMVRVSSTAAGNVAGNWTYNPRCGTATNSNGISHTCELTTTVAGHALDFSVTFNPLFTATATTTDRTPAEDALLGLIDGAASTVDVALYGLNRQSVVDALIAAHTRGVTVRVVGDDDAASGDYAASYGALTTAGIPVISDTLSSIQHNKFLVVDGAVVWTGSTNLTDTGFTLNANNSIVISDTLLAGVYTTEFEEMWGGVFHGDKDDNTPHLFDYAGTGVESYFSPTDQVAFEVWDELAAADESVHFAMFFWTDDLLTQRAIERLGAGVTVQGVWDQLGAASTASDDGALCAAGAQIGIEDWNGKLHHKFAVIDVYGSDPTVILGSYNWTASGAYENDENTLIIHDAGLAAAYYAEWQRLWAEIDPSRICSAQRVYIPLVLNGY